MLPTMEVKGQTREQRIVQREARISSRMPQKERRNSITQPATATSSAATTIIPAVSTTSRLSAVQSSPPTQQSPSAVTLQQSYAALSALTTASTQHMQSYVRARQQQQQEQRTTQSELSVQRQQQIQDELASSAAADEAIHVRLAELASNPQYVTPQQLYLDIGAVWKDALALVTKKDTIIRELNVVLQSTDDEYMAMLDRHEHDVQSMCNDMSTSAAHYKQQCDEHLARLAATMQEDRAGLIVKFQSELDVLYDRRKKMELSRLDSKIARERKEEKELDELRARDQEDYYALKVELEGSIALFEQQLEDMRCMYSLNAQKLDYNHNILLERDSDNKQTLDAYRNKIRRMKETVSTLAGRAAEAERRIVQENRVVSDDYMRLTEQYKSLQRKYAHSVQQDSELYANMRKMHDDDCLALSRKLLHSDRVIREQILGLGWSIWWKTGGRPETQSAEQGQTGQLMLENGEEEKQADGDAAQTRLDDEPDIQALTAQEIAESVMQWEERSKAGEESVAVAGSTGTLSATGHALMGKVRYSPAQISAVLSLLCDECEFLVPKTTDSATGASEHALVAGSDAILAAIGCEDCEDLDELCSLFYTSPADTTINIDRNDVSGVVKEFVQHRRSSGDRERGAAGQGSEPGSSGTSVQHEKKARKREKERRYWDALSRVVSPATRETWTALEGWLVKYNGVLRDRETLLRQTADINRQNEELRQLLDGYMKASINHELQVPPTPFLEANAAAAARR